MRVEVVAVRRVDVVAQPQAGVGDLAPCAGPSQVARRLAIHDARSGATRSSSASGAGTLAARAPVQPARGDRVVVVAGHEDDLAAGPERAADRPQDRLGDGERVARGPVAQLERVAEQHEAVDAVEALEQPREHRRAREDVERELRAEVQVGDDERSQRATPSRRGPRGCAWAA